MHLTNIEAMSKVLGAKLGNGCDVLDHCFEESGSLGDLQHTLKVIHYVLCVCMCVCVCVCVLCWSMGENKGEGVERGSKEKQ